MKVLWITNTLFPAVSKKLDLPVPVVGGWMYSAAEALLDFNQNIELGVASLYRGESLQSLKIDGITYFLIPQKGNNMEEATYLHPYWKQIKDQLAPDVVHIHGSEYPHGLAYVNACGNENVVLSIQGLVSVYERYYLGGISERELKRNITSRDFIRNDSLFKQRVQMQQRGKLEKSLIRQLNDIIGRTSWDKDHVWAINPGAKYHFCNETLRNEFYKHEWDQEKIESHSIFLSQAHYPIKGLQQMIKALPYILEHYPDVKVYVAGNDFISNQKKWRLNGFAKYIQSLMKLSRVEDKFIFTGLLSEQEMCNRYLKSNVFVCPSSIENSPNSVGEAQLLGVPCVSAYVGGVADMIDDGETGLIYRFEEVEMLASAVCRVFRDKEFANSISKNERKVALHRHSQDSNTERINEIYRAICKK
ncbi:glycosyltransferase family 4 protein [Sunxiuqinia indica]|uniref:glycosyltransferase family 4 protein n=1 Tax=Sunxiuqinia indica TaxID=2692584 RepID=UPI001F21579A|nr:glycosyltransferase family 4 protein [Sunxiuqinia indica]